MADLARLAKSNRFFFGSSAAMDFDASLLTLRSNAKWLMDCGGGVMLPTDDALLLALLASGVCGGVSKPGLVIEDSDIEEGDGIM